MRPQVWTEERRRAQSERKKKWLAEHPQVRKAYSERMKKYHADHPWTEETRKRISEALRGRSRPDLRGKTGPKRGFHPSEETCKLLSARSRGNQSGCGNKGKRRTPEQRAALCVLQKERFRDSDLRERVSQGMRRYYDKHPEKLQERAERWRKWHAEHPQVWTEEQKKAHSERRKKYFAEHPEQLSVFINSSPFSNTSIERKVRAILEQLSVSFVPQEKIVELSGRDKFHHFDFLIPSLKVAIEVDGCYWHRCPIHYPTSPFGDPEGEKRRDDFARSLGWKVYRVWEHEFGGKIDGDAKVREKLGEVIGEV